MGVSRHCRRRPLSSSTATATATAAFSALACLLFATASAISVSQRLELINKNPRTAAHSRHSSSRTHFPKMTAAHNSFPLTELPLKTTKMATERILNTRRWLVGPGSSPPTCRSKCGRCSPCRPVHVPIHPGLSLPLEYYPEAWRCKCGNKLFMP